MSQLPRPSLHIGDRIADELRRVRLGASGEHRGNAQHRHEQLELALEIGAREGSPSVCPARHCRECLTT